MNKSGSTKNNNYYLKRGLTYISHHRLQVSVVMRQKYNIYTYSTYEGPYENGVNDNHELSSENIKCAIEIPITITFKSRD